MARGVRGNRKAKGAGGIRKNVAAPPSLVVPPEQTPAFLQSNIPQQKPESIESADELAAYWNRRYNPLVFGATIDTRFGQPQVNGNNPTGQAIYQTPLFDLRYNLGTDGIQADAYQIPAATMLGITYDLFLQFQNFPTGAGAAFQVTYLEFGHPSDPEQASYYTNATNITAQFYSGFQGGGVSPPTTQLRFTPDGPLRYWGVGVAFFSYAATVFNNGIVLGAGGLY